MPDGIDVAELMRRHRLLKALGAGSFAALKKAEDLPEVQAEVLILQKVAQEIWRQGVEALVQELIAQAERLQQARDRQFTQDVITAFLLSLFTRFDAQTIDTVVVFDSASRLIGAALRDIPGEFDPFDIEILDLQQRAAEDLSFWMRNRIREREPAVRAAIESWVELPAERRPEAIQELAEDVAEAAGDPKGRASEFIVDLWAYRTFNVGVAVGASMAGETRVVTFNNPIGGGPDGRTTPFCREIHLREFDTALMVRKFGEYYDAQKRGDVAAAKAALPLLDSDEADLRGGDLEATLKKRGLGPPPYHSHCRTILQIRRLSPQRIRQAGG